MAYAEGFAGLFPIFHFDISKHNEATMKNSLADIVECWILGPTFEFPKGTAVTCYVYYIDE